MVGDALGVPHEFKSREQLRLHPVTEMEGYGTHQQSAGTWSDDGALSWSLAEALEDGFDLRRIAEGMVRWKNEAEYTAHGEVFDIGSTTARSIDELEEMLQHSGSDHFRELMDRSEERDNGNGSLMRILPLLGAIVQQPIEMQWDKVWAVSALTHRHIRAAMCCMLYLKVAEGLLLGRDKRRAFEDGLRSTQMLWALIGYPDKERSVLARIVSEEFLRDALDDIHSTGYVVDALELSLWVFLKTDSYERAVLKAVNAGGDTDTNAAITGGLAGLYYGREGIPAGWSAELDGTMR